MESNTVFDLVEKKPSKEYLRCEIVEDIKMKPFESDFISYCA